MKHRITKSLRNVGINPMCFLLLGAAVSHIFAYTPNLPKTGPTDTVVVLDLLAEKAKGKGNCYSAMHTISSLQGLINRSSSKKIFLLNPPTRVFYESENPEGSNGSVVDPGSATVHMLEDGLVPYPLVYPELNESDDHPVLLYLLENYSHLVQGKTILDEFWSPSGAHAAAVNACTFDSWLPVYTDINTWMQSKGFDFEQKHDFTGMGEIEAMNWTLDRYLDDPRRTDSYLGFYSVPAIMNDYYVATYALVYYLDGENDQQYPMIDQFITPDYYPPSTVNIGNIEAVRMIPHLQERGYTAVCGQAPNASMTSSIPLEEADFTPAAQPQIHDIDDNGLYICFSGNDGDALDFSYVVAYKNFRNDPAAGQVPFVIKINPYFIDLFPTLFAWHTGQHQETMDIASSMNDGGMSLTDEGRKGWGEQFSTYWNNCNNALRIIHFFGPLKKAVGSKGADSVLMSFDPLYIMKGYQQSFRQPAADWLIEKNTAWSNFIGFAGTNGVAEAVENIKTAIDSARSDEPIFMMVRLGIDNERNINTRRGGLGLTYAKDVMDALKADNGISRNLHFVPARDLAATSLYWHKDGDYTSVNHGTGYARGERHSPAEGRAVFYDLQGKRLDRKAVQSMRGHVVISPMGTGRESSPAKIIVPLR